MSSLLVFVTALYLSFCKASQATWESTSITLDPALRNAGLLVDQCDILLFGGLNGAVPAVVRNIYALDTTDPDGEFNKIDDLPASMPAPWFPNIRTVYKYEDLIYITCEDSAGGQIWSYDRDSSTFEIINSDNLMPNPVEDCCALGIDDKIYVIGGQKAGTSFNTLQIYDITNDQWTSGDSLTDSREDFACENVKDEYLYVFGGAQGGNILQSVERYNVKTDQWDYFPNGLNAARRSFSSVHVPESNDILLIGGDTCFDGGVCPDDGSNFLADVDVFDIRINQITGQFPDLVQPRGGLMSALVNSECLNSDSSDSSDNSDSSSDDSSDEDTLFAIGGEDIVDETPYDGVETLELSD